MVQLREMSLVLLVCLSGCGKKLDCAKIEQRLNECKVHFANLLFDAVKDYEVKAEIRAKYGTSGAYFRALTVEVAEKLPQEMKAQCRDVGGSFSDARAVRQCLQKTACEQFTRCLDQHTQISRQFLERLQGKPSTTSTASD